MGWTAAVVPAGASAVSGYEVAHLVKPVDGSEPDWSGATVVAAAAADTSVQVSGLEAATAYLVRVRASNGAGSGVWSDAAEVSTAADEAVTGEVAAEAVPDKMDAATFSSVTVSGFAVGWTAAVVPAGASAVSGYEVAHLVKPVDGSEPDWSGATVVAAAAADTSVQVSGLEAATAYLVRVRASNGAGSGVWSDAAEVSTAADEAAGEPAAEAVPDKMDAPTFTAVTVRTGSRWAGRRRWCLRGRRRCRVMRWLIWSSLSTAASRTGRGRRWSPRRRRTRRWRCRGSPRALRIW